MRCDGRSVAMVTRVCRCVCTCVCTMVTQDREQLLHVHVQERMNAAKLVCSTAKLLLQENTTVW